MRAWRSQLALWAGAALLATLVACGGGGEGGNTTSTSSGTGTTTSGTTGGNGTGGITTPIAVAPAPNVLAISVDTGTDGSAINSPFVSVTVCVPGTQACSTVDHVLVDTGSYGLRLAASALGGLGLPAENAPSGAPMGECAGFATGFSWGPVRLADVHLSGETAANMPIQVVDDSSFSPVPTACSRTGPSLGVGGGANGILGVGFQQADCGSACVNSTAPAMYFSCPSGGCVSSVAPLASQVANPVLLFAQDNNGLAIALPGVLPGGATAFSGALVFGIGTRSNNQMQSVAIYTANAQGNFSTSYKGRSLTAFIDSGSNGLFFHDSSIPCSTDFYCPASVLSLSASVTGANGATKTVPFEVEILNGLVANAAAGHLAGDIGLGRTFDWGLPFFFGQTVWIAFQGSTTPSGAGPYWGF
jgi:hypothetical protein